MCRPFEMFCCGGDDDDDDDDDVCTYAAVQHERLTIQAVGV